MTHLPSTIFSSARFRLTVWYIIALSSLSLVFSLGIYRVQTYELTRFEAAQRLRVQLTLEQGGMPLRPRLGPLLVDEELITDTKNRLLYRLGLLNGLVVILSGGLGYFLAGRTLAPIEQMVKRQHQFVGDASHELKTPLTSLRTSLEVFLRGKSRTLPQARALLSESLVEVQRLQRLTESLLTLSRPVSSSRDFRPLLLADPIREAAKRLNPQIKAKRLKLHPRLGQGKLVGNHDQLAELFTILLDNAVKYTPKGGQISLSLTRRKKSLFVRLSDTGLGISAQDLPHVFDRFYRADSARTRGGESGGYGLGLAIAKQIVQAHRGTISVTSKLGQGTSFALNFPSA